jgi:4-oxalocrotonate tautomerase
MARAGGLSVKDDQVFQLRATSASLSRRPIMPFANIKVPQAALSRMQKEEIVHRVTAMFVDYFSEAARPHTMVLIEEVPDGGYGRADEVFVIPAAYRARE